MHRNTFLFIVFLSILSALIIGINLGKNTTKEVPVVTSPTPTIELTITPESTPPASPSGTIKIPESTMSAKTTIPVQKTAGGSAVSKIFTSPTCKITFTTPLAYTIVSEDAGGMMTNPQVPNDIIMISCEKESITKPTVSSEKMETKTLKGGITANLYHDQSSKDNSPIEVLLFHHPNIGKDIFIAVSGTAMPSIIATLSLLP